MSWFCPWGLRHSWFSLWRVESPFLHHCAHPFSFSHSFLLLCEWMPDCSSWTADYDVAKTFFSEKCLFIDNKEDGLFLVQSATASDIWQSCGRQTESRRKDSDELCLKCEGLVACKRLFQWKITFSFSQMFGIYYISYLFEK